jgi:hypothetical protein
MMLKLIRRFRARNWRCRCGKHVFADPNGCKWHDRVREWALTGQQTDMISSRRSPWLKKRP